MIFLEMIIAALNQNQVKIETAKASSFVERELVAWFHRLIFNRSDAFYERNVQNPRVALGNATADGTVLKEIVDTQNRIGLALWSEFKVAYQRIVNLPHQG